MPGHGAKPIFFKIKKIKIGRPEHLLTPHSLTSDNISVFFEPLPSPYNLARNSNHLADQCFFRLHQICTSQNHKNQIFVSIIVNFLEYSTNILTKGQKHRP